MINRLRQPPLYVSALLVISLMVVFRWMAGDFDFSYFFTAGSDFVDSKNTFAPVVVQQGQGYDGQFFYRLALDPFNWKQQAYGVTIDYPQYRVQRIGYPFLAWLLAGGGYPALVPFALVLVNVLSFAGIIWFFRRIAQKFKASDRMYFAPLLVCGIYMSTAKSLSEVTELCFFLGAFSAILEKRLWLFSLFGTMAVLTRETSVIGLTALIIFFLLQDDSRNRIRSFLILSVPLLVLILWKLFISFHFINDPVPPSLGNFTWPVKGIVDGFMMNMNFSSQFHVMQSVFWMMFFIWQTWLSGLVLKATLSKRITVRQPYVYPVGVYFAWLVFSLFFSASIYGDDWSFVRVLALMNVAGLLVIAVFRQTLSVSFSVFSAVLVFLTIVRVIIRP